MIGRRVYKLIIIEKGTTRTGCTYRRWRS